ncbi:MULTISPECIES: YdcH family protein [unclassified Acidovorax]|uniref:YdcH family protein n=1 Tax=unclassified Acidovorax TaxID=2684926 RepID=UPI001C480A2A|nr:MULTISPECIES: YdcH family protein [unclassified Acidovorax]MBV7430161.1 YdcH family protein [Acidovorax sp. sif0732]MBV7451554.1 YdcH family protein [Acidovorax sp. sif0715]
MNLSLHSPHRQLIALRIEHADLDALIDLCAPDGAPDEFTLRSLKKRRLALRDAMHRLERALQPQEPA